MDIYVSSYIASLAVELRKIALRAGLTTSVFLLDMLILENESKIAAAKELQREIHLDEGP